jgi:hypothetical protein
MTLCAITMSLQWGCYSYLPVQSAPPAAQERVAVVLNDRGRFLLSERLGPTVERVEGTLVSHDSTGVVLDVSGTRDLKGGSSLWSGERVDIPADAILGYRARQFSRTKSLLLGGALVAVIAITTLGMSLDLFGDEQPRDDTVKPPDTGGVSFRGRGIVPLP